MGADIANGLLGKAKYSVQVEASDFFLFHRILCELFVREFGYALPGNITLPAAIGEDGKVKMRLGENNNYSHAAARNGINYKPYHVETGSGEREFHSISSSIAKKAQVDKLVAEASELYFKEKKERPKVTRKVKSEISI
jgi:hypothetical protein